MNLNDFKNMARINILGGANVIVATSSQRQTDQLIKCSTIMLLNLNQTIKFNTKILKNEHIFPLSRYKIAEKFFKTYKYVHLYFSRFCVLNMQE